MERRAISPGSLIPPILLAFVSGLCYGFGWLAWLFLVPLRIIASFYGLRSAAAAGALSVAVAVILQLVLLHSGLGQANLLFIATLVLMPALLICLSLAADLQVFYRIPAVYRIALITLVAAALSLPAMLDFEKDLFFNETIKKGLAQFANIQSSPVETYELSVLRKQLDPDVLVELVKKWTLNSFAAVYYVFFAGSRWMGQRVVALVRGRSAARTGMGFRLPQVIIWPFLACLASMLAAKLMDFGFLDIPIWNCLLIIVFLYGVQGSAIVSFLLKKLAASKALKLLVAIAVITSLFMPILGIVIIVFFICLGIFETWIPFRSKGVGNEDHT